MCQANSGTCFECLTWWFAEHHKNGKTHDQVKRIAVVEAASRDEFHAKAFVPAGEDTEDNYTAEEHLNTI